jgi:hypothetical protein
MNPKETTSKTPILARESGWEWFAIKVQGLDLLARNWTETDLAY